MWFAVFKGSGRQKMIETATANIFQCPVECPVDGFLCPVSAPIQRSNKILADLWVSLNFNGLGVGY
jgi:hypothetical protein